MSLAPLFCPYPPIATFGQLKLYNWGRPLNNFNFVVPARRHGHLWMQLQRIPAIDDYPTSKPPRRVNSQALHARKINRQSRLVTRAGVLLQLDCF